MGDSTRGDGLMAGAQTRAPDSAASTTNERSAFAFDGRTAPSGQASESIPDLLRDLVSQGGNLAEQQTRLVQAEVRSATTQMMEAVGAMAGAGVVAIAALGVLLMGISFLLGTAMPLWLATMIVAVASMGIAYAMFAAGKRKIQHNDALSLERSRETLERTPAAITGNSNQGQRHGR